MPPIPTPVIILLFIAALLLAIYGIMYERKKLRFEIRTISSDIKGFIIFSYLNTTDMKHAKFIDVNAQGKVCNLTAKLLKNAAGNFPDVKLDTLRAETSDESIGTATASYDPETGTFKLKTKYTGKKGDLLTTLKVSPDLDDSGDADISFSLVTTITTEEARGFDEESVDGGVELEEDAA